MNPSADLVNKLWRLCALLRKDGVTYQQYVTELTYLLFLKMASEQKDESRIPEQYRWGAIKTASETEVLQRYRQALTDLGDGEKVKDRSVVAIFQNAATIIRTPANLRQLIDAIDGLHWFSDERDAFGDAYEGLLQRMAEETKRGAGQYFTPRSLIGVMVRLMKPQPGEVIQDPAAGTGGFLIAANSYMKAESDDYFELSPKQQAFQLSQALRGIENVPDLGHVIARQGATEDEEGEHQNGLQDRRDGERCVARPEPVGVGAMPMGGEQEIDRHAQDSDCRDRQRHREDQEMKAGDEAGHGGVDVGGTRQKKRAGCPALSKNFGVKLSASRTGRNDGPWPYRTSYVQQHGCRGSGSHPS